MKKNNILIRGILLGSLASSILLSGCSLSSTATSSTPEQSVLQTYQADDYQITIPKAWSITRKNEFTSDIPQNVSAVFQANRKNEIFITNVNVTKNALSETVNSGDYGNIIMQSQKNTLQNFTEVNREELSTAIHSVKDSVLFVKFQGKRTASDPLLTFLQSYYVYGKTSYIITASYVSNEDPIVQKEAENIVRSFSIK